MEESAKNPVLKASLIYGAIVGVVGIVVAVVFDLFGLTFKTWAGLLSFLITIVLVVYALSAYKREYLGGFASYVQLLIFTLLMALFATILSTIYNYINITWLDPDALDKMFNVAYERMANNPRITEEMLDAMLDRMEGRFTAGRVVIQGFIGGYVMTVIVGVIAAAFIKKDIDSSPA
jgi:hypothetical protein